MIKGLIKIFIIGVYLSIILLSPRIQAMRVKGATVFLPIIAEKKWEIPAASLYQKSRSLDENGIFYHGGQVLGTTSSTLPNIYYIWYGNWKGTPAVNLLANFAMGIGKTGNFNINSTYTDVNGAPIIRIVNFPKPGIFDNYSMGSNLTDANVLDIVDNAITSHKLPLDPYGIYFVLSSSDVSETSGFCSTYCSWRSNAVLNKTNIKYVFVGNAKQCPNECQLQSTSPNGDPSIDAMANMIATELWGTITNPNGDGWYDQSGKDNADKCAWKFGITQTAPNGAQYNMTIAKVHYLVQMNWLNARGGMCANVYALQESPV